MGTALDKGDIDLMTRTMSPRADQEALERVRDGDIDLVEMPGLEIRYLAFNTNAPTVKSTAVRQAMAQIINRSELVSKVYGTQAEPLFSLVPATITGHSNSFFNKYGDPSVTKAKTLLAEADITTPVKLTLHYTTDHYGSGHQAGVRGAAEAAQRQRAVRRQHQGRRPGTPSARPSRRASTTSTAWAGSRTSPTPTTTSPRSSTRTTSSARRTRNGKIRDTLIPDSRREADRIAASGSLTEIQDIVADDVPSCRCGRASSTSPHATTSRAPRTRSTPPRRCSCGSSAAA